MYYLYYLSKIIILIGQEENVSWVWSGSSVLYPDEDRALLHLSPGGSDATVVREFDLPSKAFVKPEEGY